MFKKADLKSLLRCFLKRFGFLFKFVYATSPGIALITVCTLPNHEDFPFSKRYLDVKKAFLMIMFVLSFEISCSRYQ